jgi:hypothetical protein
LRAFGMRNRFAADCESGAAPPACRVAECTVAGGGAEDRLKLSGTDSTLTALDIATSIFLASSECPEE